jgi:hypothetical protein
LSHQEGAFVGTFVDGQTYQTLLPHSVVEDDDATRTNSLSSPLAGHEDSRAIVFYEHRWLE